MTKDVTAAPVLLSWFFEDAVRVEARDVVGSVYVVIS